MNRSERRRFKKVTKRANDRDDLFLLMHFPKRWKDQNERPKMHNSNDGQFGGNPSGGGKGHEDMGGM